METAIIEKLVQDSKSIIERANIFEIKTATDYESAAQFIKDIDRALDNVKNTYKPAI